MHQLMPFGGENPQPSADWSLGFTVGAGVVVDGLVVKGRAGGQVSARLELNRIALREIGQVVGCVAYKAWKASHDHRQTFILIMRIVLLILLLIRLLDGPTIKSLWDLTSST